MHIRHPAGMHRWDEEAAKLKSRKGNMRSKRWWCPAVGMNDSSRPALEQEQVADIGQHLDY